MRVLQLHSNFIEYEAVEKEIEDAEEVKDKKARYDEVLVAFIAVEKSDDEEVAYNAINEIKEWLDKISCNKILLYPYAHLSQDLAIPSKALSILRYMEGKLKNGLEVYRAPFGWTKAFTISVKGHPLAEHAINITKDSVKEHISKALEAEEKIESHWFILEPDGRLIPLNDYKFKNKKLEVLAKYEVTKKRIVDQEPPHVKLMKKLAIADYEPASDAGNMRLYPNGRLIKSLIEQYVTRRVLEYGGIEVETPIMYNTKHPSLEQYFNRFPARQYTISTEGKELFLRFAACFGQFLMAKDFTLSYKHLPLRLYELTRYSFRREKSGELVGLRRLRAFTMPDCHALCKDMEQAKEEAITRLKLSISVINDLGLNLDDLEVAIRFTREFYENNKEFVNELISIIGKPALIELWDKQFFYFVLKWEFNFIDNLNKASALSTDQIDVENGKRYNILFVDEDGNKKHPIILHNSPSGAVERVIYALLEKAAFMQKQGKVPILPLWLSPTHVRIIPVSNNYLDYCLKIMNAIKDEEIRVDLDDRDETLSKKIRDAEKEWIHYIAVIGEKEVNENLLNVRIRLDKSKREMRLEELINVIKEQIKCKPYMPLNMPALLSKRPQIMV
ncbi:MAG: threonine--tRNA ligase [Candidatus Nitrosocaldaceae archaeon]|nr:MAG: threonine--tRNA ligase [Candidatus Nitrosocaldaceae archaeon]